MIKLFPVSSLLSNLECVPPLLEFVQFLLQFLCIMTPPHYQLLTLWVQLLVRSLMSLDVSSYTLYAQEGERLIIVKLSLMIQSRVLHRGGTLESACKPRILLINIRRPHCLGDHTPGPLRTIWSRPHALPLPNNHSCLIMWTVSQRATAPLSTDLVCFVLATHCHVVHILSLGC